MWVPHVYMCVGGCLLKHQVLLKHRHARTHAHTHAYTPWYVTPLWLLRMIVLCGNTWVATTVAIRVYHMMGVVVSGYVCVPGIRYMSSS